jgi:hypothetical protein
VLEYNFLYGHLLVMSLLAYWTQIVETVLMQKLFGQHVFQISFVALFVLLLHLLLLLLGIESLPKLQGTANTFYTSARSL